MILDFALAHAPLTLLALTGAAVAFAAVVGLVRSAMRRRRARR